MEKIIFDCDPGVDDALAIILAINSGLELYGITSVHGNSPLSQTTLNACRILDYLNLDVPVAKGASKPLRVKRVTAGDIHGKDGLGDSKLLSKSSKRKLAGNAVDFIFKGIKQGVKTIVATGPLTNIAIAFKRNPRLMNQLERLVIMGGTINESGNIDRVSEFNFYADPDAADYVLANAKVPIYLVPLDVTRKAIFTEAHKNQVSYSVSGKLAKSVVSKYLKNYTKSGFDGNPLHDPLAVAYVLKPSFLEFTPMNLRVETKGEFTRGECVPEQRPWMKKTKSNVNVALKVDAKSFLSYFVKTISK